MMIRDALARVLWRANAAGPTADPEKPANRRRFRLWAWLCVLASVAVAWAVLLTFDPSFWRALVVAVLLACPAIAVWGFFSSFRPLPVPLGPAPATRGTTLNWVAPWYDALLSPLFGLGRRFRDRTFSLVELRQGDRVLDVGCGTGWLTRRAAQVVGPSGVAWGIDPAPDMIRLAMQAAGNLRNAARFELAAVEALPFEDASLDVVVACLVIHHLPPDLKVIGLREIHRVLKPGGRLFVAEPDRPDLWFLRILLWPARFHGNLRDHLDGRTSDILCNAGFVSVIARGHWAHWITFWSARKP